MTKPLDIAVRRKNLVLLFFLIVTVTSVVAQPYPSRLGRFQVDQKRGCVSFTVTVTNLLAGGCTPGVSPCAIDYGDGTALQTNPPLPITHTYTTTKAFLLKVIYQSLPQQQDDITITVDASTQPNFEIYACAGSKATIKVIDSNYEQYVIDYNNDGTPEAILPFSNNIVAPPYSYVSPPVPPPPPFTTSVRGRHLSAADNCNAKTQPFTPYNSLPVPSLNTLTSIDATSLKLDFTTAINVQYRLEIAVNNSAVFQLLQTLYGVNTFTVTGLKLDDNFYCFRLGAFDPCSNASTYSNIVCSDKFSVTPQSDVIQLNWPTGAAPFVSSYSIVRNKNPYFTIANGATQNFDDTGIICKTDYCYQITTNYSGGSKSISLEKCTTSFSSKIPTAITDVSSVVSPTGVDLSWSQDPKFTPVNYSIQRSTGGNGFTFLTNVTTTKFTDDTYTTSGKYCYKINYLDKCGNNSGAGIVTCPIELNGTLDKKNVITLVWSSYKGWKNGVKNYTVEKYNLQGVLIKSTVLTDTTFIDDLPDPANQLVEYVIRAASNDPGLTTSLSNLQELIKNANLFYPTAFTPNSDNLNDGFAVSGQFIVKMSLKVFDRWGSILFATDKNEPWDGHRDGKPLPASTYIWKAEITDLAGRTFTKEGTVVLIRK